jgi:hypothetical protein
MALHSSPQGSAFSPEISPPLNQELRGRYQIIVDDSRYRHFTRIPERIVRFLDTLHLEFDRNAVHERLLAHYLFIAVVDDAIDSGDIDVAQTVFDGLRRVGCALNEISGASDVVVVTEMLKWHIEERSRADLLRALRQAHREVVRERTVKSVRAYTRHRKLLGRATAKQSYLLIKSALNEPNARLCRLMEEIGAVGCLVDSVIDVGADQRSGLLNFHLTAVNYGKLCFSAGIAGLGILLTRPSLLFLMAEAVLDNLRDRGRARPRVIPQAASSRQSTAQSFRDNVARLL